MASIAPQDSEKKVVSDSDSDDAVLAQLGYTQGWFAMLTNVLGLMTDRAEAQFWSDGNAWFLVQYRHFLDRTRRRTCDWH